jgi:cytochrome P450 / NADPH-cytochrome P450 reductase
MTSITMLEPIPQPPGYPLVGNLFDLYSETPILHVMKLARQYGPIFGLRMPQGSNVAISASAVLHAA